MDPTVTAAAIGVGGTVIVGITGFWASMRNTSKTVSLARDGRIWDQRAAVYVDAIKALQSLLSIIGVHSRIFPGSGTGDMSPDWEALETSLQAWASESVLKAMKDPDTRHALEEIFYVFHQTMTIQGAPPGYPESPLPESAEPPKFAPPEPPRDFVSPVENLMELMRSELQGTRSRPPGHRQRPRRRAPRAWDPGA